MSVKILTKYCTPYLDLRKEISFRDVRSTVRFKIHLLSKNDLGHLKLNEVIPKRSTLP